MTDNFSQDKKIISESYFQGMNMSNIELFGYIKQHHEKTQSIFPIIEFILERLGVVTDLALENKVWDAEIVYRSALETFIKFVFITSASEEEQILRLQEYWTDLCEINSIKQSEQAKKNLAQFGNLEMMRLAFSPLVLSEERERELREKWPRSRRKVLEKKWSFTEMIASLMANYRGITMPAFVGLLHTYRMASHVSHGDETGVLIIRERNLRNQDEKEVATDGHYIKLLSDSFNICLMVAIETMHFLKEDPRFFMELSRSLHLIHEKANTLQMRLYEDRYYDAFR